MTTRQNQHFRELPSFVFTMPRRIPAKLHDFARAELLPQLQLTGYKIAHKQEIALCAIHQLVCAGFVGGCVSDSRDLGKSGVGRRKQVWDAIVQAKLARVCLGSEQSGRQSLYRVTGRLLETVREWKLEDIIDVNLARMKDATDPTWDALIVLHSGKSDLQTGKRLPKEQQKQLIPIPPEHLAVSLGGVQIGIYLESIEEIIEQINSTNLDHGWKVKDPQTGRARPVDVRLKQIHSGQLFRYQRLYTFGEFSAQSLPKSQRRRITIDGDGATELHMEASHLRIAYHFSAKLDPQAGDLYRPEVVMPAAHRRMPGLVRKFVKRATTICMNVPSRKHAVKAVLALLRCETSKFSEEHREQLSQALFRIEGISPDGLLQRIEAAHSAIAHKFYGNFAAYLTMIESCIMLNVLWMMAQDKRPALGMHDGVLCKRSDAQATRSFMLIQYHSKLGFYPTIKRDF